MTKRKTIFLLVSVVSMGLLLSAGVFGQAVPRDSIYRHLSIFTEVFGLVRSNYVEEVPAAKLVDGAFTGVSDAIDESSYYVPPAKMAEYRNRKDPDGPGLGFVVSKRFGYGIIVSVLPGSPADKAGVKAGDIIETVNGRDAQALAAWELRDQLSGSRAANVTLLRAGMSKRMNVAVTPQPFRVPVPSLRKIESVHVLEIPSFVAGTSGLVSKQLEEVAAEKGTKLIVDLRGNAGGSFDEAIESADLLLTKGRITSTAGRRVEAKTFDADAASSFSGDVIVLTDTSVSGPAEVFAAAIHGTQRGRIVGLTTYGNTAIQKFVTLPSGGGLNVTIGNYMTPDGKVIGDRGIRPDVTVDVTKVEDTETSGDDDEDPILEKGLSLLGVANASKAAAAA
jgi:carboxyl-terminal processing protease